MCSADRAVRGQNEDLNGRGLRSVDHWPSLTKYDVIAFKKVEIAFSSFSLAHCPLNPFWIMLEHRESAFRISYSRSNTDISTFGPSNGIGFGNFNGTTPADDNWWKIFSFSSSKHGDWACSPFKGFILFILHDVITINMPTTVPRSAAQQSSV